MEVVFNLYLLVNYLLILGCSADEILGCGGFIKSHVPLDYLKIEIGLYTKGGILKEKTECAPTNGYFFLPLYEKGEYTLKVHPPPGWSFEPSEKQLVVDGVNDLCSMGQDINFKFNGFGIAGQVVTAGLTQGPSGIAVKLIDDKGKVRNTVTTAGGDFSFSPVIPGKYTIKASHPKWQLQPAEAVVQVKEGNTALPAGVLSVKGYDVKGSVTGFGEPISGVYVLLYSKEERQKLKVEGCNTALLQGVQEAPICHSVTDAAGEFSFGVVPAGSYRLAVLPAPPGQALYSYDVKPDHLPFVVAHDSLYIKNAFEITGFNVVGWTLGEGSERVAQAQVWLDGEGAAAADADGRFTLRGLRPGRYTLAATHESCEFEPRQLQVSAQGPVGAAGEGGAATLRAAAWRVCGEVAPPPAAAGAAVLLTSDGGARLAAALARDGTWCRLLPPGDYTARLQLGDGDGDRYFPAEQRVAARGAVRGVRWSQLRGRVAGAVRCLPADACAVAVTLAAPGGALTATARGGRYEFPAVRGGGVAAAVDARRRCWRRERHEALLQHAELLLPPFEQTGYALRLDADHELELGYASATHSGTLAVPRGSSRHCLPSAELYTLTPAGCHRYERQQYTVDLSSDTQSVTLKAVAHANVIVVSAPLEVSDLTLTLTIDGRESAVGPLAGERVSDDEVQYRHTVFLAPGQACAAAAAAAALVAARAELRGGATCAAPAATLRAAPARLVAGRTQPPVPGVRITLTTDDLTLTQTTGEDGTYKFDPIDAAKPFKVTAEKESYVFGERDENGVITAEKLAAIHVTLVDEKDGTPLQGALVSVSGGAFRRTAAAGSAGALRFPALAAGRYFVKPQLLEYRFSPPHATLQLAPGADHTITLKGSRVAWAWAGRLLSAGGAPWRGATLQAAPAPAAPAAPACTVLQASTDAAGAFRLRGLAPGCRYAVSLKPADDLPLLRLVNPPQDVTVEDKKDVTDVVLIAMQPQLLTDSSVLVYAPTAEHYKSIRLTLSLESSPTTHIYAARPDSAGVHQLANPGLMYTLPRLPADNKTYVVKIESSLSKATHSYEEQTFYFTSDGRYKHVTFNFAPKVKSTEQELKHTSVGALPLLALAALAGWQRRRLAALAERK